MLTNENDIVNDQDNDTVSETEEMLHENAKNTEGQNDTSNNESVEVLEKVDVKTENIPAENTILNYLDPKILNVKEYTHDELNDNIEFSDSGELQDTNDIYDIKLEDVSEKQLVKGKVVAIYDKEVVVDIGFKSEGIIDKSEFDSIPEIGSEIDVFLVVFEDRKGRLILSKRRADFEKRWSELRDAAENETLLKGTVIKIIKGGLVVDLGVVNAFLPGSQVDIKPSPNFEDYLNNEYEFKIVKFNEFRQNVVVSRKATMSSDMDESRKELLKNLEVGSVVEGTVKNITDFGAFIDLGGFDGLLHITDITWGRINHPSDKVALGSSIKVKVIDYDKEKNRISLGLKQLNTDPWSSATDRYSEGTNITGKVVNMMNYGAFVEIEEGIEGLIHISEISWTKHIKHPSDIYKIGDSVNAIVLSIDAQSKKISLGVKQLENNPWDGIEENIKSGEKYKGTVSNIVQNGAYVLLENDIEGFLNVSDISWTRKVKNASDILKNDQKIDVVVLDVSSQDKRISLGLKQNEEDPWEKIDEIFQVDMKISGKVLFVLDKGIIFLLENGFEAILPISKVEEKDKDSFTINKDFNLCINQINKENRKIVLSYNTDFNSETDTLESKNTQITENK
ncbi:MAG: 30S ribosomal protein S1 [Candidatus Marinimicrobia bacterium]|nr:30S ribosomal protein S1 [Candidatus Neomarinimicrobiota bacterium]|tara:strand:+ start:43799 stop:45664 length:1866 start_codon:yes stop_codon:yes gene_type:complete